MRDKILKTLREAPNQAGIYKYLDENGKVLYIGKAKSLNKRLKSYWRFKPQLSPNPNLNRRILKMLEESDTIEYILLESETDALILENSLIKQLHPKYNILLRDDKTYPYIYIDENEEFPRFELTRKVVNGKRVLYYGPFPNGAKILLNTLYELFPLVQKKSCLKEKKACLFYQIEKCLAPCEGRVTKEEYADILSHAKESINKPNILIEKLQKKMIDLATKERFEEAGTLRDNIETIKRLTITSTLDLVSNEDADIFAILNGVSKGVVVKLFMRSGKIISSSFSIFRSSETFNTNEAYRQTLLTFYSETSPQVPKNILIAHEFEEQESLSTLLTQRFSKKVTIKQPKRGSKRKLIEIALDNAKEILQNNHKEEEQIEYDVAELFELNTPPFRVESFDNSHMMGVATVGAMVVWSQGKWIKKDYRRYKLKAKDEYGQMREMLERRVQGFTTDSPPDLWILDGGETLRRLAVEILKKTQLHIDVIAIAKEKVDTKTHRAKGWAKDIIYTEESVYKLLPTDKRLQWVQRQRDEAHRFALLYHQNSKRREDRKEKLLEKKGIGSATIKKLIHYFGTFQAIENATYNEISVASSEKIARILKT